MRPYNKAQKPGDHLMQKFYLTLVHILLLSFTSAYSHAKYYKQVTKLELIKCVDLIKKHRIDHEFSKGKPTGPIRLLYKINNDMVLQAYNSYDREVKILFKDLNEEPKPETKKFKLKDKKYRYTIQHNTKYKKPYITSTELLKIEILNPSKNRFQPVATTKVEKTLVYSMKRKKAQLHFKRTMLEKGKHPKRYRIKCYYNIIKRFPLRFY